MNKFWPPRPSPEGFSIEKLARSYKEKIINSSYKRSELSEKEQKQIMLENDKKDESLENNDSNIEKFIHWANRSFYEYKDVA